MSSKKTFDPNATLSTPLREKVKRGLEKYVADAGLCLTNNTRKLTGSKALSDNTENSYLKHYTGLYQFAAKLGDYESLLVLHESAPSSQVPSMRARTVALYMRYKTWKNGTCLLDEDNQAVCDVDGVPVISVGQWKDPGNCDQYMSAVARLHVSINQDGLYIDACDACHKEYKADKSSSGCSFHPGQYCVWRRGNPRESELVQNVYKECKDLCSLHVIKGSYQLLPDELLDVRQRLLSSFCLADLQLYTIVLVSIFLFLRHDEFHKLKVTDVVNDLSAVTPNRIASLCIKVKGKTDQRHRHLVLWAHDDKPLMCPVRHLLLYIHLCDIRDGYLFPDLKNQSQPRAYKAMLKELKVKLNGILQRKANLTTHSFRKTGYLFGVWGGGDFETLRTSARHKSDKMAQRYMDDASFLLELAKALDPNAALKVP